MSEHPIFGVMVAAVLAPLLALIPVGARLPAVVLEVVLGVIIGPHCLGGNTWFRPAYGANGVYHAVEDGMKCQFIGQR